MKILSFNVYFHPEKAASSYLFDNAREAFVKDGNTIKMFAPTPTRGVSDEVRNAYKKKKEELLLSGGLCVHRFPMYREGKNPFLRALRYFFCMIAHVYLGLREKDADIMLVSSTPPIAGMFLSIVRAVKKIPALYLLQDIFPDSMVSAGLTKEGSIIYKIGRILENYTYKHVDKIVVISEDCRQNIIKKGVPEDKIELIRNWVDETAVLPVEREKNTLFDELSLPRDKFYVTYAGNLGRAQDIEVIIRCAKLLEDNDDIKFVIFGSGSAETHYKEYAKELDVKNLSFYPPKPYERVSEVYSLGDVSIVTCKAGTGKNAMPSKTWSIMVSETPVAACFDEDTDMQQIILDEDCGVFAKAGDHEALAKEINKLYENREDCIQKGKNARKYVLENLTKEIGTKKYLNVIHELYKEKN